MACAGMACRRRANEVCPTIRKKSKRWEALVKLSSIAMAKKIFPCMAEGNYPILRTGTGRNRPESVDTALFINVYVGGSAAEAPFSRKHASEL